MRAGPRDGGRGSPLRPGRGAGAPRSLPHLLVSGLRGGGYRRSRTAGGRGGEGRAPPPPAGSRCRLSVLQALSPPPGWARGSVLLPRRRGLGLALTHRGSGAGRPLLARASGPAGPGPARLRRAALKSLSSSPPARRELGRTLPSVGDSLPAWARPRQKDGPVWGGWEAVPSLAGTARTCRSSSLASCTSSSSALLFFFFFLLAVLCRAAAAGCKENVSFCGWVQPQERLWCGPCAGSSRCGDRGRETRYFTPVKAGDFLCWRKMPCFAFFGGKANIHGRACVVRRSRLLADLRRSQDKVGFLQDTCRNRTKTRQGFSLGPWYCFLFGMNIVISPASSCESFQVLI